MNTYSVRVAASSANLGTGFDAIGVALDWYDEATLLPGGDQVKINLLGEGAATLPRDETNLLVQALRRGVAEFGGQLGGFELTCRNQIPQQRGLGSSAGAIVAGLALGWAVSRGPELELAPLFELAAEIEGHPDNVGAAAVGGAVLSWQPASGPAELLQLPLAAGIDFTVFVPQQFTSTQHARAVLPTQVPHRDAVRQANRSALLVAALTMRPDLLPIATRDLLHQPFRRELMPESMQLIDQLQSLDVAAALSGAGPSVLALGPCPKQQFPGFVAHELRLGDAVQVSQTG